MLEDPQAHASLDKPQLFDDGTLFGCEKNREIFHTCTVDEFMNNERIVMVASKEIRAEFLGLDSYLGGLSAAYYCILEYIGTGLEKGVNKLKLAQVLGFAPKDIFSILKNLEKYNLM
jgi:hypothetical protein